MAHFMACYFETFTNRNLKEWFGMVWYGMVTLFQHGISFRYTFIEKTNFLTSLKTKIKEIKLVVHAQLCMLSFLIVLVTSI